MNVILLYLESALHINVISYTQDECKLQKDDRDEEIDIKYLCNIPIEML